MELSGRYQDGEVARVRPVTGYLEGSGEAGTLVIRVEGEKQVLARWPAAGLRSIPARAGELRLAPVAATSGARLILSDPAQIASARQHLPAITAQRSLERRRELTFIGAATGILACLIAGYVFGIPLLARQIVGLVPPQFEADLGDAVVEQVEEAFAEMGGLEVCDPDPDSVANTAISRFVAQLVEDTGTPFDVSITVTDTAIPNAFALPGGRAYYFRGLLEATESPDEFAGVMAHEIGHVVYRHGMEQLIATAGTGLLVGFLLGDMTGISVAGAIGAALIDTRFSRDAERAADRFSAEAAQRLGYSATALADLLDRVAADDQFTRAMALLSTHPLTDERRATLAALTAGGEPESRVFSSQEWLAIRNMCHSRQPAPPPQPGSKIKPGSPPE